uniref:Hyaluronidase n=1 Tax=Steinernema glaseri TaxID=37863 RepID=A0A1I7ZF60_9BILA
MLRCPPWLVLLVLLTLTHAAKEESKFSIYWNAPTYNCHRMNVTIPLEQYGIRVNRNMSFQGEEVVLFYEQKFGIYPFYKKINSSSYEMVNGGLPQRVSIGEHLRKVKADIEEKIPSSGYSGLAVIDFEDWRPLWSLNWGTKTVYKRESVRYVLERYPTLSRKSARRIAITEFNKAARNFMVQTIRLGMQLRPNARWGFYGFPYCNYDAGQRGDTECNAKFAKHNDKLGFVMREGNTLYPSIYLNTDEKEDVNFRYIQALIKESVRARKRLRSVAPIFVYTKIEYDPYIDLPHEFYSTTDLCNSLKQSSDLGAAGALIWSSSKGMNRQRCEGIRAYVAETFGPYAETVINHANRCARKLCSRHGRCELEPQLQCSPVSDLLLYKCDCESPFYGRNCEKHKFPWLFNWKRLSRFMH